MCYGFMIWGIFDIYVVAIGVSCSRALLEAWLVKASPLLFTAVCYTTISMTLHGCGAMVISVRWEPHCEHIDDAVDGN